MFPIHASNFINGEFISNTERIQSIDPSNLEVLGSIPSATADDVNKAVEAAKNGFPLWSNLLYKERAAYMNKIADLIDENLEELAMIESCDQGKPLSVAKMMDIPRAAMNFRYFAKVISEKKDNDIDRVAHQNDLISIARRVPVGVAALISPWNLPLYLLTWKIAPAIAFGNTCVAKPSEVTSLTAFKLAELMVRAELPPGVVNLVFGTGPLCGEPLVVHPDVELISFTGSTKIGARIAQVTAPQVKKLSLELGGKNPAIVFADCDLDKAVQGCVRSAYTNQGEVCLCTERTFVEESIYDEFVSKFMIEMKKWTLGNPRDPATKVGALVNEIHFNKVVGYLDQAVKENLVLAGHGVENLKVPEGNQKGYFVQPTLLGNVPDDHPLFQEEIFGPVTAIIRFSTEDEVIARANNTKYGLCATVWTRNVNKAKRVGKQIRAGTVWLNCWLRRDLYMPFGGMKQSGIGRESGPDSEEFFTEQQCLAIIH